MPSFRRPCHISSDSKSRNLGGVASQCDTVEVLPFAILFFCRLYYIQLSNLNSQYLSDAAEISISTLTRDCPDWTHMQVILWHLACGCISPKLNLCDSCILVFIIIMIVSH